MERLHPKPPYFDAIFSQRHLYGMEFDNRSGYFVLSLPDRFKRVERGFHSGYLALSVELSHAPVLNPFSVYAKAHAYFAVEFGDLIVKGYGYSIHFRITSFRGVL
jgi:hypothetical protein